MIFKKGPDFIHSTVWSPRFVRRPRKVKSKRNIHSQNCDKKILKFFIIENNSIFIYLANQVAHRIGNMVVLTSGILYHHCYCHRGSSHFQSWQTWHTAFFGSLINAERNELAGTDSQWPTLPLYYVFAFFWHFIPRNFSRCSCTTHRNMNNEGPNSF